MRGEPDTGESYPWHVVTTGGEAYAQHAITGERKPGHKYTSNTTGPSELKAALKAAQDDCDRAAAADHLKEVGVGE